MDTRKRLSNFNNDNHSRRNSLHNVRCSKSKSVKTQTEETDFYCSSCINVEKRKLNQSNEEVKSCFSQNLWKTSDCVSLCPVCSRTLLPIYSAPQANNQLYPFPMPWCSPYSSCNNFMPLGMPSFLPIQMVPGVVPCNLPNTTQNFNDLEAKVSTTSTDSKLNNLLIQNSNISLSNGCESCNNSSFLQPKVKKSKLKTCIRSEPDVTKNEDHEIESMRLLNLNSFDIHSSKRNHFKSDSSIPSSTKTKTNHINDDNNSNIHQTNHKNKRNYLLNRNSNSLKCEKGDYHNNTVGTNMNKEFFKSPIYKYADIRIHELSSSLKDIKENIHKLSTKASELHISDSSIANDDNFKKYFRSIYTEVSDSKEIPVPSLSNDLNAKFAKMKAASAANNNGLNNDNINENNNTGISISEALLGKSRGELMDQLYTSYQIDRNNCSERNKIGDSFDHKVNSVKRSVPLHDLSNVFTDNYENNKNNNKKESALQNIPVKIKSDILSNNNNKIKTKIRNGKTSVISSSNCQSNFNNLNNSDDSIIIQSSTRIRPSYNKPLVNTSVNSNYDSFSDDDNNSGISSSLTNIKNKEKDSGIYVINNDLNEQKQHCINKYFNTRSEDYNNYDMNGNGTNDDRNDDDDDDDDDGSCNNNNNNNGSNNNELSMSARNQNQPIQQKRQNVKHVENWLGKTVELNSQQHSQQLQHNNVNTQTISSASGKRQSQYATLNNLEILSKISEEEEEKCSSSDVESDDMDKPYNINKYCVSNNNNNNKISNSGPNKLEQNNTYFLGDQYFKDVTKLKARINGDLSRQLCLEEKVGETWIH